jgi:hypothetical protein
MAALSAPGPANDTASPGVGLPRGRTAGRSHQSVRIEPCHGMNHRSRTTIAR